MYTVLLANEAGGDPVEVTLEKIAMTPQESHHAHLDGELYEVQHVGTNPGEGWLRIAGGVHPFIAHRTGDTLQVWVKGRTHQFTIVDRAPRRAVDEDAGGRRSALTAPMPGTILKVLVGEGDAFEAHDPLIVMESMKMEMTISAPHPGIVRRLACRERQLVEMNDVLATLDDAEGEDDGAS
jgi:biotin carboxyl carrier protein